MKRSQRYGIYKKNTWFIGLILLMGLSISGCDDIFVADGDQDSHMTESEGYFYMMDRSNGTLHMLDTQLSILKSWELTEITGTTSVQGITFDGEFIWISAAGSADRIYQLDLSGDEIVVRQDFEAPPGGSGTVRDITWDGSFIWALNNGSVSLGTAPTLYQLNSENGDIENEYELSTPEPRSLSFIPENGDEYGRGISSGFYYGDIDQDVFVNLRADHRVFITEFPAPAPPESDFRIFPSGITYEQLESGELKFWTVNSSFGNNYLFKIDRRGDVTDRFELHQQFEQAGPIVFTTTDVRLLPAPTIESVFPDKAGLGTNIDVRILGENFRDGDDLTLSFGQGTEVTSVELETSEEIVVGLQVSEEANLGLRDVTVELADGQVATLEDGFEVLEEAPEFGFIWAIDFDSKSLYQLNEGDGSLVQEWNTRAVAPGGSPQGVAWDGESIWLSAAGTDREIYRLDTSGSTLTATESIPAPYPNGSGTVRDIAWNPDTETIWVVNDGDDMIYQVDPSNGDILSEIPTPTADPRSLVWADGTLHSSENENGQIWSWNSSAESWEVEFVSPLPEEASTSNRRPQGLAFHNSNFWISSSRFGDDYILKAENDGDLLQTIESPNIGSDVIMGITFSID